MKIAIYSPYLDTVGGGEKYILSIAETLSKENDVDVLLDTHLQKFNAQELKDKNSKILGLDLQKVSFINAPLGKGSSIIKRLSFLKKYDVLFYNTDGSFFYSLAKKNIAHVQLPLENFNLSLLNRSKLKSWNLIIYNSRFTQEYVEKKLPIPGLVVYPPVDTDRIKPLNKKKQILSVGRFVVYENTKKQDVLIKSFINLCDKFQLKDYSLHLAGGLMEGNERYLENLKEMAKSYPVYFYPNCSLEKLTQLYGESLIYWHGAGFEEDNPIKMEHFGISTVEAMAGGCVPVVINKGGQKEIVEDGKDGFLWNDLNELEQKTLNVIKDKQLLQVISEKAIQKSKKFNLEHFQETIKQII